MMRFETMWKRKVSGSAAVAWVTEQLAPLGSLSQVVVQPRLFAYLAVLCGDCYVSTIADTLSCTPLRLEAC